MTATPTRINARTRSYRSPLHRSKIAYAVSLAAKPAIEMPKKRRMDRHRGARCARNVNCQWPPNDTTNAANHPSTFAANGNCPWRLTSSTTTPRCVAAAAHPTAINHAMRIAAFVTMRVLVWAGPAETT